ncbi:hypothetical protein CONLIGDRAFT_630787 [Coniochaeta ligniaria NRRL 30616]|uniref:N-acetyltransferase domain-containing protein n=1 Tax=Coniochaeta ligniaria NRRL 30616 TaxID=1408157 RepID=A0A1J7IT74_9PEZI|nr:hypothetical protein CONLIGDRAFT_630787 [Coniochaeta ligniaria NRRL 30616]
MDRPAKPPALAQPSIRSFFRPQQPAYAAPPPSTSTSASSAPPRHQGTSKNNNNSPPAIEPQPPISKAPASIPQPPPLPPPQPRSAPPPASSTTLPPTLPSLPSLPLLPPPPSLPSNATIAPINPSHIPALRRINSLLLQITYPDSFYTTALTVPTSSLFSRAILWSDDPAATSPPKVIGSIVCRLEPPPPNSTTSAIYIQSLTLLSPFRSLGLAAAALEHVISTAALLSLDPEAGVDIRHIYAHVWTENEEGLRWYASRGFKREGTRPVAGYYFRLRPDTAWVVSRDIGGGDNMSSSEQQNGERERQDQNAVAAEGARGRGSVLASAVNLAGGFSDAAAAVGEGGKEMGKKKVLLQRPSPAPSLSYQKTRPDTEWNDLPAEMVVGNGGGGAGTAAVNGAGAGPVKATHLSAPGSGTSSRSSSSARRKKERAYPAAAFGS